MEKLVVVAWVCMIVLSGCGKQFTVSAKSDYNFAQLEALKRYHTFSFVKNRYPEYKSSNDSLVEKEITYLMRVRGFRLSSVPQEPQLLVSYRMYERDILFKGYSQPILTPRQLGQQAQFDKVYYPLKYLLRKGGMLIQVADQNSGQTIWRGYISGNAAESPAEDRALKREIRSIFYQFGAVADGFLATKRSVQ